MPIPMKRSDTETKEVELRQSTPWSKSVRVLASRARLRRNKKADIPEADIETVRSAFVRPVVAKEVEE